MIGVKIKGQWLDLKPGTTLSFELNSPIYLGDDTDVLPGSFSFPFDLPLSPHNRRLLRNPDLLDSDEDLLKDEYCEFWAGGFSLFQGKLSIKDCTPAYAKAYLQLNALKDLKDKKLSDINFPMVTLGATAADALAHAKNTALNPANYDYIFCPVYNPDFLETKTESEFNYSKNEYLNYYNVDTQSFESVGAAMPFLKLDYVLRKGLSEIGYTFNNTFQTDEELKRLVLYNNFSIIKADGNWNTQVNLKQHVNSDTKYTDLLKQVCRLFCLAPFTNIFDKTLDLVPLKELLKLPVKDDWTSKTSAEYTKSEEANYPKIFRFKSAYEGTTDAWVERKYTWDEEIRNYLDMDSFAYDRTYYEYGHESWYNVLEATPGEQGVFIGNRFVPEVDTGKKEGFDFESELGIMFNEITYLQEGNFSKRWLVPFVKEQGTKDAKSPQNFRNRLMLYHSMLKSSANINSPAAGPLYPCASTNIYDLDKNVITGEQYSLNWLRPGLFNTWWKGWSERLQRKRDVKVKLRLTLRDLLNFDFKYRVKIRNQEYFVKRLRVTFANTQILDIEADLVSLL